MPELVANGPNIPAHLMNELGSGKVVFFCGAGVSAGPGSGLPTFACLVDRVYEANHTEPDGVEREALDLGEPCPARRRPSFDKALDLLERPERLGARPLRRTVIEILSARPTGSLDLHRALIELSRHEQGIRLVTTNFDNRFVDAAVNNPKVDAAPKLPVPKPHSWSSLVHLHGRILENDDGSNLVLTAADFGRAYLTERWAARFITELFREFVVVFVGYSVGDPVMSYMVDALAAERAKGAKYATAYAFADHDGTVGDQQKARERWLAKNVEPILYDRRNHYKLLSDTLIEWARIRNDPFHARSQIALNEMSKLPAGPSDPAVERVAWALQDPVAAQALTEAPPFVNEDDFPKVERWVEVLAEKGLLGCVAPNASPNPEDQDRTFIPLVGYGFEPRYSQELDGTRKYLARWIARHLHVPQLLAWAIRSGGHLHPQLRQQVQASLADSNLDIPPKLRFLWTVLSAQKPIDHREHLWTTKSYSASASESERRHIESEAIKSIAPRLVVHPGPYPHLLLQSLFDSKPKPIRPIDECGHLKLVSGEEDAWHRLEAILKDPAVLSRHAETLTNYLDQALTLIALTKDVETVDNATDSLHYRPSIATHDQNRNRDRWTRLIDLARDSYFVLSKADRARGDNLLRRWVLSGQPLFKRLALHALTENPRSDIRLATKLLVTGRKPGIWELGLRREVLRFLRKDDRHLPRSLKVEIVLAIHDGPKTKSQGATPDKVETIRREKALRLCKLIASGARLDKNSRALAEEMYSVSEDGYNERNEFISWIESPRVVGAAEFMPEDILDKPIDDVATALEKEEISRREFWSLARLKPVRTASTLRRLSNREAWPSTHWKSFLWAIAGTHETSEHYARLRKHVARMLEIAPAELFAEVESAAATLVKDLAEEYGRDQEHDLKVIWTKAWGGIGGSRLKARMQEDLLSAAFNHPAGTLADAALIRLYKYKPKAGKGLPSAVSSYFSKIAEDPNGKLGRVVLVANLHSLYSIDRRWVENNLIPRLNLQSSKEARDLWSAYGWSPTVGPDLFLAFKSSFLEVLRDADGDYQNREYLVGLFVEICLEAPNELTDEDIHGVIAQLSEEDLQTVLRGIKRRLRGSEAERARVWHDKLRAWLQRYWPMADGRNTGATSKVMLCVLVECGDAFEDAVACVLQYLKPLEDSGLDSLNKYNHAEQHQDSMLTVLNVVVGGSVLPGHQKYVLCGILNRMRAANCNLDARDQFQRLYGIANG